ncbi:MAG: RNA-dependent DNA polymerase [Chloroflexi bacterium]|nr:RNA-dependent DNA polymerase [Ardenticatenaceae bacterium]NOG36812.1 RNA-dependent DNA polymerase [Chloroflexota bacterium]
MPFVATTYRPRRGRQGRDGAETMPFVATTYRPRRGRQGETARRPCPLLRPPIARAVPPLRHDMKTFKNLYPKICSFATLETAFHKARRGKRSLPNVAAFETNLDAELLHLADDLRAETYRPGGYRHFTIYDGKPRRISAAPFRDRVVHHALCHVTEPIWEARFIADSYACRLGKGTHAALDRCTQFARRYPYVLQCDIVQFFPSVDHAILREALAHHIACPPTLRLIDKIINSGQGVHQTPSATAGLPTVPPGDAVGKQPFGTERRPQPTGYEMQWFPGDDLLAAARPRGLPIGNQTSQFWANVYLHGLDQFVKQELRCPAYLRYCDDFMLFADDKPTLHRWRREIEQFLITLRLKIHAHKTSVHPVTNGIPFLGFLVFPTHRRLKQANGLKFQRRYKGQLRQVGRGELSYEQLDRSVQAWIAHAAHGDTWGLRRSLLRPPIPRSPLGAHPS